MKFPSDVLYDKSHDWARFDGAVATVGITDFAQSELGDIVFVDVTVAVGDQIGTGDVFGTIEAVKTVSDLIAPVSGTVTEINPAITDAPESINNDPYGDGWIIRVETSGPQGAPHLMAADAYKALTGQ